MPLPPKSASKVGRSDQEQPSSEIQITEPSTDGGHAPSSSISQNSVNFTGDTLHPLADDL
jgi:hypothetical protein